MTTEEQLAAILQAVQIDPGQRGLARHPARNLFNACSDDFAAACQSLVTTPNVDICLLTGFVIPTANPPAWETDGPLGTLFLLQACQELGLPARLASGDACIDLKHLNIGTPTHLISIERVGPGRDGRCRTMRGHDMTELMFNVAPLFSGPRNYRTIGIGDGGNEFGMGKIPGEVVAANIPNGEVIHCQVATDYLVVAGVSNWGAYALAAGLFVLIGRTPSRDLFSVTAEYDRLVRLVEERGLVDGVTGLLSPSVDGLSWETYSQPLRRLGEIIGCSSSSSG